MKKILMILYGNIATDARVIRAANALTNEYEIHVISFDKQTKYPFISHNIFKKKHNFGIFTYLKFIYKVFIHILTNKYDIFYGHDIFSCIPLYIIHKIFNKKTIIYDSHELYIDDVSKKIKFFLKFEKKVIFISNQVICASEERAEIMKKYFGLTRKPNVIKNISYVEDEDIEYRNMILDKFSEFFNINAFSILYAGGIINGRKLDVLVDVVNSLGDSYKLFIVGNGNYFDSLSYKIEKLNNRNIKLIKSVPFDKLGTILRLFDSGYLFYGTHNLNNRYCASNKIYEYASAGLPIISNDNPTVKKVLVKYNIGYANEFLEKAIKTVEKNLSNMRDSIPRFIAENKWEDESDKIKKLIAEE